MTADTIAAAQVQRRKLHSEELRTRGLLAFGVTRAAVNESLDAMASVVTSKLAIEGHFKTGHRAAART
jgi:hypothetical protein